VGGDRDGHPFVTGDVTRASFASYEHAALELHRGALVRLASRMGLSVVATSNAARARSSHCPHRPTAGRARPTCP
jgi:phosphoenolpyruvate carboxylase